MERNILNILILICIAFNLSCQDPLPVDMRPNPDGKSFDIVIDRIDPEFCGYIMVYSDDGIWKIKAVDNIVNLWWLKPYCQKSEIPINQAIHKIDFKKKLYKFYVSPYSNDGFPIFKISKDRLIGLALITTVCLYSLSYTIKKVYQLAKKVSRKIKQEKSMLSGELQC
jgi:hypothetical protein